MEGNSWTFCQGSGHGAQRWYCQVLLLKPSPVPWHLRLCPFPGCPLSPDRHFSFLHTKIPASASHPCRSRAVVLRGGWECCASARPQISAWSPAGDRQQSLQMVAVVPVPSKGPCIQICVYVGMYGVCLSIRSGLYGFP